VVLGDSVALGHGVADDETFAVLLEKRLENSKSFSAHPEVINMSVSGFGTAEELILLENVALGYSPDVVILAYFVNDHFNNVVSNLYMLKGLNLERLERSSDPSIKIRDWLSRIPGYGFLAQHSHLVVFLRRTASSYFQKKMAIKKGVSIYNQKKSSEQSYAVDLTVALLHEFQRLVVEEDLPLIIVNIPNKKLFDNFPHEKFKASKKTVIIEMKNIFQQLSGNGPKLFYEFDSHPTAWGHEVIARELESALSKLNKIGSNFSE
jgi:lysophospholipase L1-like esterase